MLTIWLMNKNHKKILRNFMILSFTLTINNRNNLQGIGVSGKWSACKF